MAVFVIGILRPGTYPYKHQDDDIRYEIRQGMDGVGYHCSRVAHKACSELESYEQQVYYTSGKGYPGYCVFAFHKFKDTYFFNKMFIFVNEPINQL